MLTVLCPPLRIPRAAVDPICGPLDVLGVVTLALSRPLRRELIAIACDDRHRGMSLSRFVIADASSAAVCDAIDRLIGYCSLIESSGNVVIGVGEPNSSRVEDRIADARVATEQCHRAGIALREWLVVTRGGVTCARSS